ncbi:OsmC family protein [Segnochrobactrum spirostomi]|uniref:OsmC family protein n=1 Tax=Segnochrobactrum spirostomi TaxID=2608987 RepID=A0A6A7Y792_9HYPH|nr:OsmC family protein [Segnochrobactrum spirostomi]MQT15164.1 OsmC family protein [Segnochrobactrum spirostomi]
MALAHVKYREVGAVATLGAAGPVELVTPTGGTLTVATAVSEPGFSPIDLLHSSLAACLVLSAKIAANRLGVADRIVAFKATVGGEKAADAPSRIARFDVAIEIEGDIDDETRRRIVEEAETICTVSNTLHGHPQITVAGV